MKLVTVGITHHQAPVAVRERVAFAPERLDEALRDLAGRPDVQEAAILSTCNRTELYCVATDAGIVADWLASWHGMSAADVAPWLFQLEQGDAVRHVFRVASGLDSMVLGETQIQGQVKQAMQLAREAGTAGSLLNKLFQHTFATAKEIRSRTEIGANSVSMAAASVRLAERIFPSIAEQRVLFVGAGEMIELCASHFAARRPKQMTVANRTRPRAEALARRLGGQAIGLAELPNQLAGHDIIITSTASPLPIIGLGIVERAIRARRRQPMFMVDLAVPRDIEPEVAALDDVYLYTVDELSGIVEAGVAARQAAAVQAEELIDAHVAEFLEWLQRRETVPTIMAIREHAERLRQQELARATRRLAAGDDPLQVVEQLSQALTNKFLHVPNHALNHLSGDDRTALMTWLQRLYPARHQ